MSKKNVGETKLDTPASTPMCDVARACDTLRKRLTHYRDCSDPRCVKRREAFLRVVKQVKSGK